MKNKKYTFGDITFEIDSPVELEDKNNCSAFVSEKDTDYRIRIRLLEAKESSREVEREGRIITRYVAETYATGMSIASLLSFTKAAYIFLEHDAFILHASYIVHEGQAILFTAPSGTGKSTQAEFWRAERDAEIVNGDRVLVTRRNGKFYANGIYASGTSGISKNQTAPIRAVVLLDQAEENTFHEIPPRMLFMRILCETSYDMKNREQCEKITELVSDMINTVPVFCYKCRNNPDAVAALERILSWEK